MISRGYAPLVASRHGKMKTGEEIKRQMEEQARLKQERFMTMRTTAIDGRPRITSNEGKAAGAAKPSSVMPRAHHGYAPLTPSRSGKAKFSDVQRSSSEEMV